MAPARPGLWPGRAASPTTPARCTSPRSSTTRSTPSTTPGIRLRDQGRGKLLVSDPTNLHAPIGLILAPNGNLIVANSDAFNVDTAQPSELVEYTQKGVFVARHSVDPANGGAFGLAIANGTLAAVDDNVPALEVFTFPT